MFFLFICLRPDGPYRSAQEALLPGPVYGDADSADAEYELQRIVDRWIRYKKFEYLVEYKGYPLVRDYEWRPQLELLVICCLLCIIASGGVLILLVNILVFLNKSALLVWDRYI